MVWLVLACVVQLVHSLTLDAHVELQIPDNLQCEAEPQEPPDLHFSPPPCVVERPKLPYITQVCVQLEMEHGEKLALEPVQRKIQERQFSFIGLGNDSSELLKQMVADIQALLDRTEFGWGVDREENTDRLLEVSLQDLQRPHTASRRSSEDMRRVEMVLRRFIQFGRAELRLISFQTLWAKYHPEQMAPLLTQVALYKSMLETTLDHFVRSMVESAQSLIEQSHREALTKGFGGPVNMINEIVTKTDSEVTNVITDDLRQFQDVVSHVLHVMAVCRVLHVVKPEPRVLGLHSEAIQLCLIGSSKKELMLDVVGLQDEMDDIGNATRLELLTAAVASKDAMARMGLEGFTEKAHLLGSKARKVLTPSKIAELKGNVPDAMLSKVVAMLKKRLDNDPDCEDCEKVKDVAECGELSEQHAALLVQWGEMLNKKEHELHRIQLIRELVSFAVESFEHSKLVSQKTVRDVQTLDADVEQLLLHVHNMSRIVSEAIQEQEQCHLEHMAEHWKELNGDGFLTAWSAVICSLNKIRYMSEIQNAITATGDSTCPSKLQNVLRDLHNISWYGQSWNFNVDIPRLKDIQRCIPTTPLPPITTTQPPGWEDAPSAKPKPCTEVKNCKLKKCKLACNQTEPAVELPTEPHTEDVTVKPCIHKPGTHDEKTIDDYYDDASAETSVAAEGGPTAPPAAAKSTPTSDLTTDWTTALMNTGFVPPMDDNFGSPSPKGNKPKGGSSAAAAAASSQASPVVPIAPTGPKPSPSTISPSTQPQNTTPAPPASLAAPPSPPSGTSPASSAAAVDGSEPNSTPGPPETTPRQETTKNAGNTPKTKQPSAVGAAASADNTELPATFQFTTEASATSVEHSLEDSHRPSSFKSTPEDYRSQDQWNFSTGPAFTSRKASDKKRQGKTRGSWG